MSDIEANAGVIASTAEAFAPSILLKSNLWSNWSRIAIDHGRTAREYRDLLVREWQGDVAVNPLGLLLRPHAARRLLKLSTKSGNGSGGRIRTYDQAVNSRPLYH